MSEHLPWSGPMQAPLPQPLPPPAPSLPAPDVMAELADVAGTHGLGTLADRLSGLWRWLDDDLDALNVAIAHIGDGHGDLGWRSARYLLARPGKRIRPVCLALAARLGGRFLDIAVRDAAIACELVHAATLLHDDVIDEGELRRGAPAARRVYGNSACVLGGDQLLVEALRHVGRSVPQMREELVETLAAMVGAEALQLQRRRRFDPDRAAYLAIVAGKTAALFRWALQAGGVLGGLPARNVASLARFGEHLGVAFQMIDDVLDLQGDPATTGKGACADLREGKLTWPLLLAAERDGDVAAQLGVVAGSLGDVDAAVAAALVEQVDATGGIADTLAEATRHADLARIELRDLPAGRARDALFTIVDAALQRSK